MDNPLEAGSPPPAQLDEAPRQLPFLPTEILQRIIQLALPRLSFKTFRERYDVLLICCRVNKLWAALAQRELSRHACCRTESAISPLCDLRRQGEITTQSLWLHGTASVETASREMSAFGRLRELYITKPRPPEDLRVSLLMLLVVAKDLQVLALDYSCITFNVLPSPATFPQLRRLALSCFPYPSDLSDLLCAASFPLLDALSVTCAEDWSDEDATKLSNAIIALAPQLLSFSFASIGSERTTFLAQDVWPALTSVQHLTLHHKVDDFSGILSSVPTSLVSLRLRAPVDEMSEDQFSLTALVKVLANPPDTLKALRTLTIPPIVDAAGEYEEWGTHAELASSLEEIDEIARDRGIEVCYSPEWRHSDFMEHIEHELSLT